MKFILLFIAVLFSCFSSHAQVDLNNPPWAIGCDKAETQTEMNACSARAYGIADSVLNVYYDNLLAVYADMYLDSADLDKDEQESLLKQQDAIIRSKDEFHTFRESTVDVIGFECEGGSMCPMVKNSYRLELTINQIKVLDYMLADIMDK